MNHAHWSLDCPCCKELSTRLGSAPASKGIEQSSKDSRLSTTGLEHVYSGLGTQQEESSQPVEVQSVSADKGQRLDHGAVSQLEALSAVLQEQTIRIIEQSSRLEAASYRIGYLEALVAAHSEELKLLPDFSAKNVQNISQDKELQQLTSQLQAELTSLKNSWWNKLFSCLFLKI